MYKLNYLIYPLFFLGFSTANSQPHTDLAKKDLFNEQYPKVVTFRGEYVEKTNVDYNAWAEGNIPSDGVIKKYVNWDEMSRVNLETQIWASQFFREWPEKLMLLHWDAREHRNDQPGNSDLYFPGHWVSFPGTNLTKQIDSHTQTINVQKISLFNKTYPNGNFMYPTLLIVEIDSQGNRLWDRYEYVELKKINLETNDLLVERATALSDARSFPEGMYIAPMSTRLGRAGLFDYNYSLLCPEKNDKKATDVLLEELQSLFRKGAPLEDLQGIAFDVLNWYPRNKQVDTNNDGIADGGIINGINYWREGALQFMEALRDSVGNDFIMTGDSYNKINQRALHLFNGMESEGLVEHNDAFRGFSKTINIFTFWNEKSPFPHKFNYIVDKLKNQNDLKNRYNFRRLTFGTAACISAGVTRVSGSPVFDEMNAGLLNQTHWLGQPEGPMIRLAENSQDLLKGSGVRLEPTFIKNLEGINCTIQKVGDELIVKGPNTNKNSVLKLRNLNLGKSNEDLTIYFEIMSLEPDKETNTFIPRTISAHVENLPKIENSEREDAMYNHLWGYFNAEDYTKISLYYRKSGGRDLDLNLEIEGQSAVKIKNITIHQSPAALAREFNNGVVLVNPSLSSFNFDLSELFPGEKLKKIQGFTDPDYNNGRTVGPTVEVPPLNALFLIKQ